MPETRRRYVLTRASIRWRTFKARLRKFWLYHSTGERKGTIKENPPWKYPWITKDDWNKFIGNSNDPKFKVEV